MIAKSMLRMLWACAEPTNAVWDTLQHIFSWRSPCLWRHVRAHMLADPINHTRWKHKWRWHNRGCAWDKLASEWVAAEDWTEERDRCMSKMDMRDFVEVEAPP